MSQYYLGDPCYVIPDKDWGEFCDVMNYDGSDFEFKGHTCKCVGTGGDGDFGGLSVDAGIIGIVPIEACDPAIIKAGVSGYARLINDYAELEFQECGEIIIIDGEALNGYECECNYHSRNGYTEWLTEDNITECQGCGITIGWECAEFGSNDDGYCSEDCMPPMECEVCYASIDRDEQMKVCEDCLCHSECGCEKEDPYDDAPQCDDCVKDDEKEKKGEKK